MTGVNFLHVTETLLPPAAAHRHAAQPTPTDPAEDPRAIRSRQALLAAAAEELRQRPAGAITATDVVKRAKVSRPTLYQHFGDLTSLLVATAREHLAAAFEQLLPSEPQDGMTALRHSMTTLLTALRADAALFRHATRGPGGYQVIQALITVVSERLHTHSPLRTLAGQAGTPPDLERFLATGVVGLVAEWLDTDFLGRDSVASLTDRLMDLMTFQYSPPAQQQNLEGGIR